MSYISSLNVVPIGISTRPTLLILPPRANTLVPLDFSVPTDANSAAPSLRINGTQASVSTLLTIVGLPHRPDTAGKGGRGRGIPLLPSIELRRAVSSPHTKAPAPSLICALKLKPEPIILSPSNPFSSICLIAILRRLTATGYSART